MSASGYGAFGALGVWRCEVVEHNKIRRGRAEFRKNIDAQGREACAHTVCKHGLAWA